MRSNGGRITGSERTVRPTLRTNARDKEREEVQVDSETVLRDVPRDPTIAAKFNTYRFADYKEDVIDLLRRVCTVSVRTMEIVDGIAIHRDGAVTKMEEAVESIG